MRIKAYVAATVAVISTNFMATDGWATGKVNLELSGSSKWFLAGAWNNPSYAEATGRSFNNAEVKGQSEIVFSGSTTLDNGLHVGVETSMVAGANTGIGGGDEDNLIDSAYLYVDSGYGKINLGVVQNGTHLIHVQAPEAIGQWGDGGLLTDNSIIQNPDAIIGINGNQLNSTSILPGQSGALNESITYLTPTVYGVTLVATYVPNDMKNVRGPVNLKAAMHDLVGTGVNYTDSFDGFGVKASAAWAHAQFGPEWDTVQVVGQDMNFYNAGLNLSYAGFTLGGSFRWNDHAEKGHEWADQVSLDGHAWDAGLVYSADVWTAGLSWYKSRIVGNSYRNGGKKVDITFLQASASYNLGPGVNLQGLVGYGNYKASTVGDAPRGTHYGNVNQGWTALGGMAIEF